LYGIIGEDQSDVETLCVLIKRIADDSSITIKRKGYDGCGQLLTKGARQLQLFHGLGVCKRFVVCYDSDRASPAKRRQELIDRVIGPSGLQGPFCALVPVQEIEAWILADLAAVTKIIKGWTPTKVIHHPETIADPKELLEKMSREFQKPRYAHAVHNPRIALHLDLEQVLQKCPSFEPLHRMVTMGKGNV